MTLYLKKRNIVKGKNYDYDWYTFIISNSETGYYSPPDSTGAKKILFKFKKNVFDKPTLDLATGTFLKFSKLKHSGRGIAAGILPGQTNARTINEKTGQNEGQYVSSNISGYYDRPLRQDRGKFETQTVCRTTAFTLNNPEKWNSALPFVRECSDQYKKMCPKQWAVQRKAWGDIDSRLKIPKTVFTTITSNYNWRTACHCDSGDFEGGLSPIIVTGENYDGGYLGFPEYQVLIKIEPGDLLLIDSHAYHCNTQLKITKPGGFRLSFVMYIRKDMHKCKRQTSIGLTKYLV